MVPGGNCSFFEDGSFGDSTVITHKGLIYGFNSYASHDKKNATNYIKYVIADFATTATNS